MSMNIKRKEEYDKLSDNTIETNNMNTELAMTQETYQQLEKNQGNYKLVLEFPNQPVNSDTIKQEVKSILASALQEHLKKSS